MQWTQTQEIAGAWAGFKERCVADAACGWPQSTAEFERLVEAVQDELVRYAYCRLRNLSDAEDVVQDILVDAYADRERHRGVAQVRAYLYRMTGNRCTDLLRKQRRSGLRVDEEKAKQVAAPPALDHDEPLRRLRRIEELISTLPDAQAEVMRLRAFAGLPFASIAEAVGASEPTVKSRFRYGVERLRLLLTGKETRP